ncbi:MAG: SDR family oxidoreductase [Pseudomonadales bacterium]|nr:SDR family oxidoreductase [Pseudomonadales bacterium]
MSKALEGQGKTVLITGASAGIGKAFADVFATNGFDVVLVARRIEKLEEVASELESKHGISTLCIAADLAKSTSAKKIYDELKREGVTIDALVNNAGYAITKPFTEAKWKDHSDLMNVMVNSVTQLCYLFAKDMKANGYGRIINLSSVAAFSPQYGGNLYGATKAFVKDLSEALDLELKKHNVYCTALCPGFTRSEFHDVMGVSSAMDKLPKWIWMDAKTVANQGYRAVMRGDVRYVNGILNKSLVTAMGFLPGKVKYFLSEKQNVF